VLTAFSHGRVCPTRTSALGPQGCSGHSGWPRVRLHFWLGKVSHLLGVWVVRPGGGGRPRGWPVQFFFGGGLGSSNSLGTILPTASTGDSFTVIPGLESQVTSPLSSARGNEYDGRYGVLRGELPRGSPTGRFRDLRSLGMFGDL